MTYETRADGDPWVCDGSRVVQQFVSQQRGCHNDHIRIDQETDRLAYVIGRIADLVGINLLDIIEPNQWDAHPLYKRLPPDMQRMD